MGKTCLVLLFVALIGCASTNSFRSFERTFQTHSNEVDLLLQNNNRVSLAIVVESINNPSIKVDKDIYSSWAKGIEDQLIAEYATYFISRYGKNQSFELLDRNKVNKILDEYTFQYQGLTRQIDTAALGQFSNATHLLIVTFTRFTEGKTPVDAVQGRLVTVKEAKILSVNRYSYKN